MSDEFYLPEEVVEWIAQKKSELLAWVLTHQAEDDIPFEQHTDYADRVAEVLEGPDESWSQEWEGHEVLIHLRMFQGNDVFWMFVVSLNSKVLNDPMGEKVLIPIIAIPTWEKAWLRPWLKGKPEEARRPLQ